MDPNPNPQTNSELWEFMDDELHKVFCNTKKDRALKQSFQTKAWNFWKLSP
jgi:hypothetical protein